MRKMKWTLSLFTALMVSLNINSFMANAADNMMHAKMSSDFYATKAISNIEVASVRKTYQFTNITEATRLYPNFTVSTAGNITFSVVSNSAASMSISLCAENPMTVVRTITIPTTSITQTVTMSVPANSYYFIVAPTSTVPVSGSITVNYN